jgi:hypothetical protein
MRRALALLLASSCMSGGGEVPAPEPANLVRDGARPLIVRRGDVDGDGMVELVVASVSESPRAFGLPTPYLEVFAYRDGAWRRVFDATGHAPQGKGTPPAMLEAASDEFASGQAVDALELVPFPDDDAEEIVAAISNVGATAGPLELWVISMSAEDELTADYYMRTERGGRVAVRDDTVAIEFAVYKPKDPGCCPSSFEVRVIGYDPERDTIDVIERERHSLEAA